MGRLDAIIRARNKWQNDEVDKRKNQSEASNRQRELEK